MSLLGRRPRELYRVYEEEEAFDPNADPAGHDGPEAGTAGEAPGADRGRLLRRGLGVAALVGGVGAVAGVIAAPHGGGGRPSGATLPSTPAPRRQAGTVFAGVRATARPHRPPQAARLRVEPRIASRRKVPAAAQGGAEAPAPAPATGTGRMQSGADVEFDFERR